jgi:hypothetical protein
MMISNFRSWRTTNVQKTKISFRYTFLCLSLLTISPLIGCTSPATPTGPKPVAFTAAVEPTSTEIVRPTATSLTFHAEADAVIRESDPYLNHGDLLELHVDGGDDLDMESLIRFTVKGISSPIHSARLRVYATHNASRDDLAIYATSTSWDENTITWSRRPTRVSAILDEHNTIGKDTWIELDVTLFIIDDETYSFVLTTDGDDAVTFSSREGSHPPQLVITLADGPTATAAIPVTGSTSLPAFTYTQGPTNFLTFIADMDARVKESSPNSNYGTSSRLQADNDTDPNVESFIRFTVSGVSGQILQTRLRLYVTTNGSRNGPAAYSTEASWTELGITWNTRPPRTSRAVDNKDRIKKTSWVEYDVTALVNGDGKYSFVLAADSSDAIDFSSREGIRPPQLVITLRHTLTPTFTSPAYP